MSDARIDSLEYAVLRMRRDRPFVIATHASQEVVNILVRVRSDDLVGVGVIAPNSVTGDTEISALSFLQTVGPGLLGSEVDVQAVHGLMSSMTRSDWAARCGLDTAIHDLLGQIEGKAVCDLLGRTRDSIETSVTVGLMESQEAIERALELSARGFRILKVKVGLDMDRDIRLLEALRDALPDACLRVDCNQAHSVEDSISFIGRIAPLNIQFVEQPVAAGDLNGLVEVAESSELPIMADESIRSAGDIDNLAAMGGVEMVNIKLAKCGGIFPAMEMARRCELHGLKVMVGCMSECEASISAGLHFALSQPCVEHADLDSHLSLVNDPTSAFSIVDGILTPSPLPGLGVTLVEGENGYGEDPRIEWKAIR